MDGTGGAVSAKMNIVTRRMDEIHPCPTNAKTHDQKQVDNVANCIRFAGWTQPIVIAADGEIVIGHCRYLAARQLGCKEVPCLLKDELDERQLRALRVLDNKLNESPWDADLLKVELDDLDFSEMGIDVDFDIDIGGGAEPVEGEDDAPDANTAEPPDSVRGAVYALGNHLLMCGDATNVEDVGLLMGGERADICFTSPPYNVQAGGSFDSLGESNMGNNGGGGMYNGYTDNLTDADYSELLIRALGNALAYCDDALFNIGIIKGSKAGIFAMFKEYMDRFCDVLVWKKRDALPMGIESQKALVKHICELVFCFNKNGSMAFSHAQWKKGEGTNLIETSDALGNDLCNVHHATFPVSLAEQIVAGFSESSVLDLFGGTGTTAIAAEKQCRKCYMMEIDPVYCDVIRKRWAEFTSGAGCDWKALTPRVVF